MKNRDSKKDWLPLKIAARLCKTHRVNAYRLAMEGRVRYRIVERENLRGCYGHKKKVLIHVPSLKKCLAQITPRKKRIRKTA